MVGKFQLRSEKKRINKSADNEMPLCLGLAVEIIAQLLGMSPGE